ncbi:MAG: hypothetical protein ABR499_09755 [Gemmatimonadaceae bacterium]
MEDPKRPFAAFVLETLTRRSAELGQWWAERAQLSVPESGEPSTDGGAPTGHAAERLVRTLLDAAGADVATKDGARRNDPVVRAGWAIGIGAHRRNTSLHQLLEALDLLAAALLRAAERAATEHGGAMGRDGLEIARRIAGSTSLLRLAASSGYTRAVADELRERYRAIRHDLRNPLGTIKSAVALLTDESVPKEMHQSLRVRAMVTRNASSLDQMIGEALGDDAAHLPAFGTPREPSNEPLSDSPADLPASGREQRDDVARARQRPDLESGAL